MTNREARVEMAQKELNELAPKILPRLMDALEFRTADNHTFALAKHIAERMLVPLRERWYYEQIYFEVVVDFNYDTNKLIVYTKLIHDSHDKGEYPFI